MTTTKLETTIHVDQDVPLVRITREFDAPARPSSARTPSPSSSRSGAGRATSR